MALDPDDINDIKRAVSEGLKEGFKGVDLGDGSKNTGGGGISVNRPTGSNSQNDGGGTGVGAGVLGLFGKFTDLGNIMNTYTTMYAASNDQFGIAAAGIVSNLGDHAGALLQGNMALSSHTDIIQKNFKSMVGNNSLLGKMADTLGTTIQFLDSSNQAYKGLAEVGAGFAGDLLTLEQMAAGTRMTLEDFSNMVATNSTRLGALGGTVDGGARAFAMFSKQLMEGPNNVVAGLMNLGLSMEEVNEYTLDFLDVQRRNSKFQQMDAQQQNLAVQEYVRELDVLAKLTGRSRKEIQNELMERQNAGNVQARIRLLEMQGIEGANEGIQNMQKASEGMPPKLKAMVDTMIASNGAITDDQHETAALFGDSYNIMSKAITAMNKGDFEEGAQLIEQAKAAAAKTMTTDATYLNVATTAGLTSIGDTAATTLQNGKEFADSLKKFADANGIATTSVNGFAEALNAQKTALQQDQTAAIQEPIVGAINQSTKTIADTRNALVSSMVEEGRPILEQGFNKLQEGMAIDPKALNTLVQDGVAGVTGAFNTSAHNITTSAEALLNSNTLTDDAKSTVQATLDKVNELTLEYNKATTQEERDRLAQEINALLNQLQNAMDANKKTTEDNKSWMESLFGGLSDLNPFEGLTNWFSKTFGGERALGGVVDPSKFYMVGEKGPELFIPDTKGEIMPNDEIIKLQTDLLEGIASLTGISDVMPNPDDITNLMVKSMGGLSDISDVMPNPDDITNLMVKSMGGLSDISSAMTNLPISNMSRQVTARAPTAAELQMKATEGLADISSTQLNNQPSFNPEGLNDMFENLKGTMGELVEINRRTMDNTGKNVRATKNMGNDVYRGV